MTEKKKFMIGNSSFFNIMQSGYYYVDKSLLVKELLDNPAMVTLITRPRRFGKTLNMDMLRAFFEKGSGCRKYFEHLKIWEHGEQYTRHCEKYPVISISLKDVKGDSWEEMYRQFQQVIMNEIDRLEGKGFLAGATKLQRGMIDKILGMKGGEGEFRNSLQTLCLSIAGTTGINPVVLIDEYDVPIHEAHEKGYYEQALAFEKTWLSGGLKDNGSLDFAVVTGVLRIAKESIFSDLNNLKVYPLMSEKFSEFFGFTEDEIKELADYYLVPGQVEVIKEWYDGYRFGSKEIYNPWSVVNFFSEGYQARTYWNQTSRNELLHSMLRTASPEVYSDLREMLVGENCQAVIYDSITYDTVDNSSLNQAPKEKIPLFTLLVMTGYLKVEKVHRILSTSYICDLAIPNKEIKSLYAEEILDQCRPILPVSFSTRFENALLMNKTEELSATMREFLLQSTSAHDLSHEAFYQGLMSGLCAVMYNDYYLTGNMESGEGRYDIQLKPKMAVRPGILIELKVDLAHKQDSGLTEVLTKLADKALFQIMDKEYMCDLRMSGCKEAIVYGMAFKGKHVEVRSRTIQLR